MKTIRHLFLIAVALALHAQGAETVRVRADKWMPFNGDPKSAQPGYVVDILHAVFDPLGIQVDYQTQPWDDALAAAGKGEIDGVICANRKEVSKAGLVAPKQEVTISSYALFSRKEDTWTYKDAGSLAGLRLGYVPAYGYWDDLVKYAAQADAAHALKIEADDPAEIAVRKLAAKEIDAYPEAPVVFYWTVRQLGLKGNAFRQVYQDFSEPSYVAFTNSDGGRRFAKLFDEGMVRLRSSGELAKILERYGVSDWR